VSRYGVNSEVLRVLATHQVHATLFCITERVERTPWLQQLLVRAVQEGHELGNWATTCRRTTATTRTLSAPSCGGLGRRSRRWRRRPDGQWPLVPGSQGQAVGSDDASACRGGLRARAGDVHSNDHDFRNQTQYHIVSGLECIRPARNHQGQSRGLRRSGWCPHCLVPPSISVLLPWREWSRRLTPR
jgi:hypothetical protein